jgi:DNA-binding transcriptional LysR family regulator
MMSMRALECLVTIVDQGSLTQAAAVLHMSQPALSHQIAAIERELSTPVIERLPRGVRPTAAGLAAAAEARIALAAADRAVIAGKRVAAGTGGRIRISCVETMTAWVLVPVLRHWRRRFPDVELDLKEYTSADRMQDVLLAGGTDIAVGPRPTRTDEHTELLGREEIVLVASPEHRFAGLARVPLAGHGPLRDGTVSDQCLDHVAQRRAQPAQGLDVRQASARHARSLDPPPGRRAALRRQEVIRHGRSGDRDGINEIHGDNEFAGNGEPAAAGRAGRHVRTIDIRNFDKCHEFFETLTSCRRHK